MQSRSDIFRLDLRRAYLTLIQMFLCIGLVACGGGGNQPGGTNGPATGSEADPSQSGTTTVIASTSFEQARAWKVATTIDGIGDIYMATISGSRVYSAEGSGGLRIFDVSNPKMPRQIGSIPASVIAFAPGGGINSVVGVKANGNIAAVSSVRGCSGFCSAIGNDLLQLYDVTDASNPKLLSSINTSGSTNIIFEGRYLYHVIYDRQTAGYVLQIVDVNDLSNPVVSGSVNIRSGGWISKLGGYIYASSSYGSPISIDVTDPAKPTVLYAPDESFSIYNYAPYLAGFDHALFVAGAQGDAIGITLVDETNPASPQMSSKLASVAGLAPSVTGHFLYTTADATQYVYDVADPMNPIFVSSVNVSGSIKISSFNDTIGVVVTSGDTAQAAQLNFLVPGH